MLSVSALNIAAQGDKPMLDRIVFFNLRSMGSIVGDIPDNVSMNS